jgi:hypothetical protein
MHQQRALKVIAIAALFGLLVITGTVLTQINLRAQPTFVMWVNHLDFLPGDATVITSFNSTSSGVGSGLSGLVIQSTTPGEAGLSGSRKVIETGLQVPPGYLVTGVRICYQATSFASFVTQVRLAQLQDPPNSAIVILDDGTDQLNPGPICVNSQPTTADPRLGALRLSIGFNFGNLSDRIVIRGVSLRLQGL